jgi:proteic killer suppression protein
MRRIRTREKKLPSYHFQTGIAGRTSVRQQGLPINRFEALSGDRAGQYSIRVNQQWRLCFEWKDTDAYNVEIVDYH